MIGQDELISRLKSYSLTTLPRSILLLGEQGCGKHTLLDEMSLYFNLNKVNITELITADYIDELYQQPIPTIYYIEGNNITDRQQNAILKFLEEPPVTAIIVILCDNKLNMLETIVNRCSIFEFKKYNKDVLQTFIDKDDLDSSEDILSVCRTPGQIKLVNSKSIKELKELCVKIATKLSSANFSNTLTIVDKINYEDDFNKFDINVFFNMLILTLYNLFKEGVLSNLDLYRTSVEYSKKLRDSRLNKKLLFENFLTTIWRQAREY